MDPRKNPYAPGAGTQPPELAGRTELIERAAISLDRIRGGLAARSFVLYGLRGVGKTVLLNRIRVDAESRGLLSVKIEAPEDRSLPSVLIPPLRALLHRISKIKAAEEVARRALLALGGFAKSLKLKYKDIEIGFVTAHEDGLADSGDLDADLAELLSVIGAAARASDTAIVLYIDELQYIEESQLAALIAALHSTAQSQLPITMVAAGLPQLLGQMGEAKSYAERLFEFASVDQLDRHAATAALAVPAHKLGVNYNQEAVNNVLAATQCYPYFIQEWGKHCWNIADVSPITLNAAKEATERAVAELDESFFRVRLDRLTPLERSYLHAMALLGPGPHRSGDIAAAMQREVSSVAPTRSALIKKGMVYSPAHGDTAFTVPLFDEFMRRKGATKPEDA